ncbi:MAG TPA: zinc ribbon domain-containing protein [Solirubrobacteraceae bacterium]|jgi:hypothetical protein|nr:zinc ribbon domain-containing protein [Solirubrobacteraceae bacterium]
MGILRDPLQQDSSFIATQPLPSAHRIGAPLPAPVKVADGGAHTELQRNRDALAEQVTEMHWDLGGLAYEMAIRDHFRLDVLVRRAAVLQERDAELAEVERLLRMEHDGVAGGCPNCAAPHSRGALYCWQCGTTLMERRPSDALIQGEDVASVMDALLVQPGGPVAERPASADE